MNKTLMLPAMMIALMVGAAMPVHAEAMHKETKTSEVIADEKPVATPDFVKKASMTDMFEIQSAQIALEKSTSDPVKEFAQMMIKQHGDISENMKKTLMESKTGLKPAASLDADHAAKIAKLKSLNGPEFDAEYLKMNSEGHDKAVALYENYSVNGDNETLKALATTTLPMIKAHNDHLKGLAISK
jgi:putative membrane protein